MKKPAIRKKSFIDFFGLDLKMWILPEKRCERIKDDVLSM